MCNFQLILHVIRPYLVYNTEVFSYSIIVVMISSLIFFQTGRVKKKIKYPCRAVVTRACIKWARRENAYENVTIITRVSLY